MRIPIISGVVADETGAFLINRIVVRKQISDIAKYMQEIWKPVSGFEGLYSVSSLGRVRSEPREVPCRFGGKRVSPGKMLSPFVCAGYPRVILSKDNKASKHFVHRLVLQAFVGPCPLGWQGCHNNGNRLDASLSNLRWDTPKGNHADRLHHGTLLRGERGPAAKLTQRDIDEIRMASGSNREIGLKFGISKAHARRIRLGVCWKDAA